MKATEISPHGRGEEWVAQQFDAHARDVFRFACAELKSMHEAQDVVQDTFVIAWRKRTSIELIDGSALPWLLTTARYICLAHHRREARRRTDTVPPERLHEIAADTPVDFTALDEVLAGLQPADRRVIELVLIDGFSYAAAAERLGLSVSATGKRLQRGRDRLRAQLRPDISQRISIEGTQP